MVADDAVVIVRDEMLRGYHVLITAERIESDGTWLAVCLVDGVLYNARHVDFPREFAEEMLLEIDAAYF